MDQSWWRGRKVLVTGGCGFLGSYLMEELVASGAQVTVADNLETGTLENLAGLQGRFRFIQGDLKVGSFCEEICRGSDVVMNLVGRAFGMGYSMHHHGEMLYHNAITHLNMLEAARLSKAERFLLVSTSCVYSDDAPTPTPELEVTLGLPEQVNAGYGWAKRIAELQARYYHREYGMPVAIARPFNPYGGKYRWSEEKSHVVPTLVKRILDGEDPVIVWGSGKQRRDLLHARDAVRLLMKVTERYACGQPVNIGYDQDVSIAELVSMICEISGRHPKVIYDTSKPEGRFRKCADPALLRKITDGYEPKIGLKEGIQEMVEWYHRSFGS